jgi:hypothetical protein
VRYPVWESAAETFGPASTILGLEPDSSTTPSPPTGSLLAALLATLPQQRAPLVTCDKKEFFRFAVLYCALLCFVVLYCALLCFTVLCCALL